MCASGSACLHVFVTPLFDGQRPHFTQQHAAIGDATNHALGIEVMALFKSGDRTYQAERRFEFRYIDEPQQQQLMLPMTALPPGMMQFPPNMMLPMPPVGYLDPRQFGFPPAHDMMGV